MPCRLVLPNAAQSAGVHRGVRPGLGRNRIGKQGYDFGNYEASLFDRTICEGAFVEEVGKTRAGTGS